MMLEIEARLVPFESTLVNIIDRRVNLEYMSYMLSADHDTIYVEYHCNMNLFPLSSKRVSDKSRISAFQKSSKKRHFFCKKIA